MTPVLIVAHGQPSDPGPAAKELRQLAARVAQQLPDHRVSSATLAEEGALAEQLAILGDGGRVYPLFMAGGWLLASICPRDLLRPAPSGGTCWNPLAAIRRSISLALIWWPRLYPPRTTRRF